MLPDYDRAVADLEAAVRIDPNHAGAKQALEMAWKASPGTDIDGDRIIDAFLEENPKYIDIPVEDWPAETLDLLKEALRGTTYGEPAAEPAVVTGKKKVPDTKLRKTKE